MAALTGELGNTSMLLAEDASDPGQDQDHAAGERQRNRLAQHQPSKQHGDDRIDVR